MTIKLSNIKSVTDFRKDIFTLVDRVVETDEPEVLTKKGEAVAVVMSAKAYQQMTALADRVLFEQHREGIERGMADVKAGRTIDMNEAMNKIAEDFGIELSE